MIAFTLGGQFDKIHLLQKKETPAIKEVLLKWGFIETAKPILNFSTSLMSW